MIVYPELGQYGRCGNQLWEIAGTVGLALAHGQDYAFPTDWSYRPWFSVPDDKFADVAGTHAVDLTSGVDERHRYYLQDHRYWRGHDELIRRYFAPSEAALDVLQGPEFRWFHELGDDKIALHVRRGDMVEIGPAYNPLPTLGYYRRALDLLPKHPVVVFSDEIAWCRSVLAPAVLAGREHYFFEGVTRPKAHEHGYAQAPVLDWIDLQLMAMCTGHVIANSSYSWWGAWLSEDPMLLYPDVWHGPALLAYADPAPMFVDPRWKKVETLP